MKKPRPITDFSAGDVVFDEERPDVLGVVTEVRTRGITVVFANGARAGGGSGMLYSTQHRTPRARVVVPAGALGNQGWNREQAVTAALRRAGFGGAR